MPLSTIHLPGERTRAQELYQLLRSAILDGMLAPNERLVEEAIARQASVSRTPVREAIHKLQMDGLVQQTAQGLVVCAMTSDELAEFCAVRETLEGMANRIAAESRTELDLLGLQNLFAEYRAATQEHAVPRLVKLNHEFHEAIWRASRNRYLFQQLLTLRSLIERLQPTTLDLPARQEEALLQHERTLRAIERRDADEAEHLARMHFRHAMAIRLARERSASSIPSAAEVGADVG